MTKEKLAAELNDIQYPVHRSITKEQIAVTNAAGLVIVFGASDDLMELEGAIRDEFGCYDGGTTLINAGAYCPTGKTSTTMASFRLISSASLQQRKSRRFGTRRTCAVPWTRLFSRVVALRHEW